MVVVTCT